MLNELELKLRNRNSRVTYWLDMIIFKNGEEWFFNAIKDAPVSRFNNALKKSLKIENIKVSNSPPLAIQKETKSLDWGYEIANLGSRYGLYGDEPFEFVKEILNMMGFVQD